MQSIVRALLALQEIDRDLFRVRQEFERLPVDRDRRRATLDEKLRAVEDLKTRANELRLRVREIEDAASTKRERIRKIEKAAGETRGDASLHANYEHEKRSLAREITRGDEEALGYMERVEALEAEAKQRRDDLAGALAEFEQYSKNVETELAAARLELDEMEERRKKRISADLEPQTLELYERLLIARSGDAMAALESNVCQGCFISVPSNLYVRLRKGTEIIQCPSCDRILYAV